MKIIWKKIKNFENYKISNTGEVYSIKTKKILKQCVNKYGYIEYCLKSEKKQKRQKAHRLVAQAFIPNPNNYSQVNHKDENKLNNCVENLEWCTPVYNSNYGTRGKRIAQKLSITLKKKVAQIEENKIIKIWDSALDAEKETKIFRSNICKCCKNERKTAGGFKWQYL